MMLNYYLIEVNQVDGSFRHQEVTKTDDFVTS